MVAETLQMNGPRLLCFQHRLGGLTGHRYPQALGLLAAARKRHMASLLLMGADATPALRAALPGRPVLRDPTFRQDLSFDQRSSAFEAMLHQYVDTELGHEDWLLITTATQCEGRAAVHWLARIPARRRPWTLVLIPSDRWNRHGPAERERQVAEFRKLAADLASAGTEVRRHLIFATHTSAMAAELVSLLGTTVLVAPIAVPEGSKDPVPAGSTRGPPVVGLIGGARPEKGSDLVPAIVTASRRIKEVNFVLQLANELLPEETFAALCRLEHEPGIRAIHGGLDFAAYHALLTQCDIVLLPYERIPYRQRTSSILVEAALAGRPVVVPAGTWLGDQVTEGRAAGIVYGDQDPETIAKAVARCVTDLPALAAEARKLAPSGQSGETMEKFVNWLAGEIQGRSAYLPTTHRLLSRLGF